MELVPSLLHAQKLLLVFKELGCTVVSSPTIQSKLLLIAFSNSNFLIV